MQLASANAASTRYLFHSFAHLFAHHVRQNQSQRSAQLDHPKVGLRVGRPRPQGPVQALHEPNMGVIHAALALQRGAAAATTPAAAAHTTHTTVIRSHAGLHLAHGQHPSWSDHTTAL